jgi:cyclophilin family peptidyl-prolyl cis-trans isomerase
MRFAKLLVGSATLLFASTSTFSQTATSKPSTTKPPASTYDHTLLRPSLLKETAPATYQVKFVTTRGEFTVTVNRAWAPLGADRFYNLVKHHYYDGARVYRVVPGFVAQFGVNAHPPLNVVWPKATIKDDPVTQKNLRGTLTFAKTSEPNSRTVEIFINLKDNTHLDGMGFAPFGTVDDKGMNVVEMFYDQYPDPAQAGEQANMEKGGEQYIASKFPKLDTITSATIVGAAAPAKPAAKPAASKPKPQAQ